MATISISAAITVHITKINTSHISTLGVDLTSLPNVAKTVVNNFKVQTDVRILRVLCRTIFAILYELVLVAKKKQL